MRRHSLAPNGREGELEKKKKIRKSLKQSIQIQVNVGHRQTDRKVTKLKK